MPWMSRLLGPPSETISSVSERASALAADQIAGAGTMAPAASPETDFRKSRRFMRRSNAQGSLEPSSQASCQRLAAAGWQFKHLILLQFGPLTSLGAWRCPKAPACIQRGIIAY